MPDSNQVEKALFQAFKKLKSSAFFDKTQPVLRQRLVEFEGERYDEDENARFIAKMRSIAEALTEESEMRWNELVQRVTDSMRVLLFPKNVIDHNLSNTESAVGNDTLKLILNSDDHAPEVDRIQCFIDMDIEGFLLGELWVLTVGFRLDETIGDCSYGNRMSRKFLDDDKTVRTWRPYAFEPYFSQYESWRDKALDLAERALKEDRKDVAILTLDLKSFYYCIDMCAQDWEELLTGAYPDEDAPAGFLAKRLNSFARIIVERYSALFYDKDQSSHLLPIGFPPSAIIANWCLAKFDKAVNDRMNPLFYGRYVDDIIVVEKIEQNSELAELKKNDKLSTKEALRLFFRDQLEPLFLPADEEVHIGARAEDDLSMFDNSNELEINPSLLNAPNSRIKVQGNKVKLFFFRRDAPDALIKQFRKTIARNSSEFKLMPDVENLDMRESYDVIYDLKNDGSPNKFREVDGIKIDSFELSKYLGKYERTSAILDDEDDQAEIAKELINLFDASSLVRFYTTWEKLFETLVCTGQETQIANLVGKIIRAVVATTINKEAFEEDRSTEKNPEPVVSLVHRLEAREDIGGADGALQKALIESLTSYLARASALLWSDDFDVVLNEILKDVETVCPDCRGSRGFFKMRKVRKLFCETYMIDKYAMPILPTFLIPAALSCGWFGEREESNFGKRVDEQLRLFSKGAFALFTKAQAKQKYEYPLKGGSPDLELWHQIPLLPFVVRGNDLEFSIYCQSILRGRDLPDPKRINERAEEEYLRQNFMRGPDGMPQDATGTDRCVVRSRTISGCKCFLVDVPRSHDRQGSKLSIAVGNLKLEDTLLENALKGNPVLSHGRYSELKEITDQAKRNNADLLVLPELCVPFDWLPRLSSFSANTGVAIACGVEYVPEPPLQGRGRTVSNLTAEILPYKRDSYCFSKLLLHEKVHMAPCEKEMIENLGIRSREGNSFELIHWKDAWFPVYCCFELASAKNRTLFSGYADFVVAVEWNRDVNYYSNILVSLARDMSCYCVQVNNSKYGDSRIVAPDKTERMDILRVKGGRNAVVLVGDIDIDAIRDCQMKNDGGAFKPPAPDFNHEIAAKKIAGTLTY